MPRSERRRWWLERGTILAWHDCWMRHADGSDDHATRYEVALWRLVQQQRIRLARNLRHATITVRVDGLPGLRDLLLYADDAVLEARCEED